MKYNHGGEKYDKHIELDFSANVNPFGMPPEVVDVLSDRKNINGFVDYPDSSCLALRQAIAENKGISEENVFCGNGASDIIYRLCFAVKPKKAVLAAPCFSEYEKAVRASGGEISFYDTSEENNFCIQSDFVSFVEKEKPDIVFICSPSNPVGVMTEETILEKIAELAEKDGFIFVVDECFGEFVINERYSMLETAMKNKNVVVLDAFTKIYGMAGLRLGMMYFSNDWLIEKCSECGGCWNVSAPAQLAGATALKCRKYVEKTVEYIHNERKELVRRLSELGFKVYDGYANYILFRAYGGLYEDMLKRNVLIRQCGNYRMLGNEYYRIAVRTKAENDRLIEIFKEVMKEKM